MGLHTYAHLVLIGKDRVQFEMDGPGWLRIIKVEGDNRFTVSMDRQAAMNLLNDLGIAVQAQWDDAQCETVRPEGEPIDPAKMNVGERCSYTDGDTRCLYCQGHAGPHEMATSEEYPWQAPVLEVQG